MNPSERVFLYTTYESFSYAQKSRKLRKRAVVYLPRGYNKNKKYNVLYLMHGGWSDETTYLGSPEDGKGMFANVLDHAIANGEIEPIIVVCPTYNNTRSNDSSDYSLALQLTNNYHNELMNDLLPAVAKKYSTYAKMVRNQGYTAKDFFIFAASGTEDFAYSGFKSQIRSMEENSMFTPADNERDGNIYFLEKKGFQHDGYAAMTYFYTGLTWLWK